ncbi:MAG TPA: hypothetical protein VJ761_22485 [Ktedonobacteraceae bacterium]|nr:hypothetical protein [Ktedonobacteraceae bacterium]
MPTQEERLLTLEQKFATFEKETAASIQEIDENTTILLGVIRHQGRDIKRIFESVETINQRLDEHRALLTEILARLPKEP